MNKRDHQVIATWIFGAISFVFLIGVFLFGPDALPFFKQKIIAVISALLVGFFTYFLTGTIEIYAKKQSQALGLVAVKATGGIGMFLLVLVWWSSDLAPVRVMPNPQVYSDISENNAKNLLTEYIRYAKEMNYNAIKLLYIDFDTCESCQEDLNNLKAYEGKSIKYSSHFNHNEKTLKVKITFGLANYYEPTFNLFKTKLNQLKIKEVLP